MSSTRTPAIFRSTALALLALLCCFGTGVHAQSNVTPAQYLASQPKPNFKPGHHLPHLTRWGWQLSSNACVELAWNWGYTLDLGWAQTAVANLKKSNSMETGFIALANSDPSRYALSVLINKTFPSPIPDGFFCTNSSGQFLTNGLNHLTVCPEGPDSYWTSATESWVKDLRTIRSNAPIAIVLNGGEYGLDVAGYGKNAWLQDPRVQEATNHYGNLGPTLSRYASDRKAHQLGFLTTEIRKLLPDRELYIFYNTGNEQHRYATSPIWYPKNNPPKNWFNEFGGWGWNSDVIVTNTDLPSFEDYYDAYNNGWLSLTNPWPNDILTRHLDAVGYNVALTYTNNYSWLNGGSGTNINAFSDIPHYMGFLKCLYTSGMVGGVAAYFNFPTGGFDVPFPITNPPPWLLQIVALGHVHALFSHFDNFLYSGDLLPGSTMHLMAGDQPAYEFTNTLADATARVLARKLRTSLEWLVTAWASAGDDRMVTVNIQDLGQIQVLARVSGAVHLVTSSNGVINTKLVDLNGVLPTPLPQAPTRLHRL